VTGFAASWGILGTVSFIILSGSLWCSNNRCASSIWTSPRGLGCHARRKVKVASVGHGSGRWQSLRSVSPLRSASQCNSLYHHSHSPEDSIRHTFSGATLKLRHSQVCPSFSSNVLFVRRLSKNKARIHGMERGIIGWWKPLITVGKDLDLGLSWARLPPAGPQAGSMG